MNKILFPSNFEKIPRLTEAEKHAYRTAVNLDRRCQLAWNEFRSIEEVIREEAGLREMPFNEVRSTYFLGRSLKPDWKLLISTPRGVAWMANKEPGALFMDLDSHTNELICRYIRLTENYLLSDYWAGNTRMYQFTVFLPRWSTSEGVEEDLINDKPVQTEILLQCPELIAKYSMSEEYV